MDSVKQLFFKGWRVAVLAISLVLIAYVLYFHRISSLLPGYSSTEIRAYGNAASWHTIVANPVNAPYKFFVWLFGALLHHGIVMTRIVASAFGSLAVLVFFMIIRNWYSYRVAFLATILFATSAGFLHSARLGSGQVLQMSILMFMGTLLWYRQVHRHRTAIGYAVALLFALLWYIPGMVWFELFGVALLYQGVRRQLQQIAIPHLAGWTILFLVVTAPLGLAAVHTPHVLVAASGLPPSMHSLSRIPSNLLNGVMSIGVRSNGNPLLWVGHTPLLNVAELALGAMGAYFYLYRERTQRSLFLVGSVLISLLLISFGGSVGFASLVPILYLFIASGLDHLLSQWLAVFPRNPIARLTGIGLICIMLFFSVLYQVRSYFVVWPHTAATRQTFNHPE